MNSVERSEHLWILGLVVFVLTASFLLTLTDDSGLTMSFPGADKIALPPACISRIVLGMPCPGCGLTRSFVALSAGDLSAAIAFNPMGPVLYLICLLQIPYRIAKCSRSDLKLLATIDNYGETIAWITVLGLVLSWLLRLFFGTLV